MREYGELEEYCVILDKTTRAYWGRRDVRGLETILESK